MTLVLVKEKRRNMNRRNLAVDLHHKHCQATANQQSPLKEQQTDGKATHMAVFAKLLDELQNGDDLRRQVCERLGLGSRSFNACTQILPLDTNQKLSSFSCIITGFKFFLPTTLAITNEVGKKTVRVG